jgi:NitT/TauT family transport system permease protein
MKITRAILKNCIVLVFWLCIWQVAAQLTGNSLLLPSPLSVLARLGQLVLTGSFWRIVLASLLRILCGTAAAVALGCVLAVVCCRWRLLNDLLSPLLTIIKSTPVASFIILLLIWIGRDALPAVIVLLMVLPVVWGNVCAGIRTTDPLPLRTAKVFGFSRWRTLRRVYVPWVMPHFLSACRTSLGLAWKSGIAAEVLTVPALSIGKMLYESKLYWEVQDLFAWTVMVILCSLVIEKVLMAAIGRLGRQYPTGGEDA